ncbi:MAG TPA: PIN domain-containing protein [Phycisphaerae bacterium]|nr:PIN domain-containing protein [Phycisphaerae bacterium]
MGRVVAVYDACVLYPAPLRDLLMHVALEDLFLARWTEAIHEEWMRNVLRDRPDLRREQLERTRALMNAHVRDCVVEGYEPVIPQLELPDPDDRHVLGAAIHAEAQIIVTFNLADFPARSLRPWGIESQHPDEFVNRWLNEAPDVVCRAAKRQRGNLKRPPVSVATYLELMARLGLVRTAVRLRGLRSRL